MGTLEDEAKKLEEELSKVLINQDGRRDDETLRFLYENYHKRFLQDNKQIWDNGKIMVPFSLSAFGLYANLSSPSYGVTLILAFASIALSFVWLINAENHRAFQNKSFVWMRAIERILVGPNVKVPFKISDDTLNEKLSSPAAVNITIRWFTFLVLVGWVIIIIGNGNCT